MRSRSASFGPAGGCAVASAGASHAATHTRDTQSGRSLRIKPPAKRAFGTHQLPAAQGSGTSKCSLQSSNACFVPCFGARLHEVELVVVELQVGPEGVEEVARDLLALVALELLDQAERLLRDHDAVGGHPRHLAGPPVRARLDGRVVGDLGEDREMLELLRGDACRR